MRKVVDDISQINFDSMDKKGLDTKSMRIQAAKMLFEIVKLGQAATDDETLPVKFRQEQQRIGVYAGQTLTGLLNGLDEASIDEELRKMEMLMLEIEAKRKAIEHPNKMAKPEPTAST